MYTICWTTEKNDRKDLSESHKEVEALLVREGLENPGDVLVFGPDAKGCLLSTAW